jgi:hypothetical protein
MYELGNYSCRISGQHGYRSKEALLKPLFETYETQVDQYRRARSGGTTIYVFEANFMTIPEFRIPIGALQNQSSEKISWKRNGKAIRKTCSRCRKS